LERAGNDLRLIGKPRGTDKAPVIATGKFDPNNDLISLYFGNYGTTLDLTRADAEAERGYYPRGRELASYDYAPPLRLEDGWPIGTLDDAGMSQDTLSALMKELAEMPMGAIDAVQIHSLLIARHGKLVVEEYFHGFHRDVAHDTRSAGKSLTSILTGAAIASGAPFGPSTKVVDAVDPSLLPKAIDPRLAAMRVEHLLTMSSGFDCDDNDDASPGNEDAMQQQRKEPNWWRYTLAVPMAREPGTKAIYCSINPNLVGAVLSHETGRSLPDLFHDLVAQPMQINRYYMNLMPTGDAYMAGGIHLRPRDFLKFGQLVLDGGMWRGRRIVGRDWIARSTSHHADIGDAPYGYLWWLVGVPFDGRVIHAVQALGNGGQVVVAIPMYDLVVAFTAGNYNSAPANYPRKVLLPKYILPAVLKNRRSRIRTPASPPSFCALRPL
jgi:CubicO group peptidase (beta-lactamase class C family)